MNKSKLSRNKVKRAIYSWMITIKLSKQYLPELEKRGKL